VQSSEVRVIVRPPVAIKGISAFDMTGAQLNAVGHAVSVKAHLHPCDRLTRRGGMDGRPGCWALRAEGDEVPMPHHTPLIATLVGGLVLAFILGALTHRMRISPLAGYLLA
jgi:hypothetical protein